MAIKLNEITNFTHKKTAMLSGADCRFVLRLRALNRMVEENLENVKHENNVLL